MSEALRTIHVGLGPIGLRILRAGVESEICHPVACVDIAPQIAGESLPRIAGNDALPDIVVHDDIADALNVAEKAGAEIAVVCTGSRLAQIEDQFHTLLARGLSCISTCEELVFPWLRSPEAADRLDAVAVENRAALLAAGVNPGFVLDLFPYMTTRVCCRVDAVEVSRSVDASRRRRQLQEKIGCSMTPEEFDALAREGRIGHVGLAESAALLADSLGWQWEDYEESIEPLVAEEAISTDYLEVAAGEVRGQHQKLTMGAVSLELLMALDAEDSDRVRVDGEPSLNVVVPCGIHGDIATAGAIINFMRPLTMARPGLRTVTEVPLG